MANFTIPLWRVEELNNGNIGLDDYDFWTDNVEAREQFNKVIRNHFYNREIGQETWQMFVFNMKRKMDEIMPLYNELFRAQAIQFDPLLTMRIQNKGSAKSKNEADSESEGESTSTAHSEAGQLDSSFPQVGMQEDGKYATSGTQTESNSTGGGTAKENAKSTSVQDGETESTTEGFQGSQAALIMEYARSRMNVTMMVVEELEELFMQVWSTQDDYTSPHAPYFRPPFLPNSF